MQPTSTEEEEVSAGKGEIIVLRTNVLLHFATVYSGTTPPLVKDTFQSFQSQSSFASSSSSSVPLSLAGLRQGAWC